MQKRELHFILGPSDLLNVRICALGHEYSRDIFIVLLSTLDYDAMRYEYVYKNKTSTTTLTNPHQPASWRPRRPQQARRGLASRRITQE